MGNEPSGVEKRLAETVVNQRKELHRIQQETERLKAQVQGSQAMADEKCRCFLERAVKAETELQQALEERDNQTAKLKDEISLHHDRVAAYINDVRLLQQQLAQSQELIKRWEIDSRLQIKLVSDYKAENQALQRRLDEALKENEELSKHQIQQG